MHQLCSHACLEQSGKEIHNLDSTDDGEAGEKSHGASDDPELSLQGHFPVLLYLIKGRCVKVYLNQLWVVADRTVWKTLVNKKVTINH